MFIDSSGLYKHYDLIIVGAGPAGLILAQRYLKVRGKTENILIIESGDKSNSPDQTNQLSLFEANGDLQADYYPIHNQRKVGGTSTVWSGFCTVLEERAFLEGEWPISYRDLYQYYADAAKILELPPAIYERPEAPFVANPNVIYKPYYLSPPKRFDDDETLLWLEQKHNVHVLTDHSVFEFVLNNNSVRSVLVKESSGSNNGTHNISASVFVAASGGVQNSRLLQLSLPTDLGLPVGSYFCEHPHYYKQFSISLELTGFEEIIDQNNHNVVHAIGLSSQFSKLKGIKSALFDITQNNYRTENLLGKKTLVQNTSSTARSEMSSLASNKIALSSKNQDNLGQPIAKISLKFNPTEVNKIAKCLAEELARSGVGRMNFNRNSQDITGGGHMIGTTRMGESPKTSVTNKNCKVHGVSNLYVAGSSLFSAAGSANPTLTIAALSLRLADHLGGK